MLEYGETATLRLVVSDGYEGDDVEWRINDGDNSRYVTLEGNRLTYSSPRLSFMDGQVYVVGCYPGGSPSAGMWISLRLKDTGYQFTDRFPFIYEGNSQQLAVALTETIEGMTIPPHTFRLADEEDSEFLRVSPDGMAMALKYPYDYRVILVEAVDGDGNVLCTTEVTIYENISHAGNMVKGRIDAIAGHYIYMDKVLADYFGDNSGDVSGYELSTDNPELLWVDGFFVYGMNVGEANLTITPKENPAASANIEVTVRGSRDFTFSTLEYKYNEDFKRWAYHIKAGETATVALESNLPVGKNWTVEMESGHIGLLDVKKLPGNMIEITADNRGGYNLFKINSDDYCNSYGEIYVISYVEEEKPVEMASTEAEVAAGVGVKIPVTLPEEVRGTEVTWSSDNEDVAEVHHHTGVVTTKAFGTATITAHAVETEQGASLLSRAGDEPVVTVTVHVGEIASFTVPAEMEAGKYGDASFTLNPAEFSKDGCRWISSRPEIASIDAATGRIHAIAPGTTLIQLETPVGRRQEVLTVSGSPEALPALTLDAASRSVRVGEIFRLTPNMEGVTWSTSDRNVAVVDVTGLVIVTGEGSAIITATTADGRSASCRISTSVVVVGIEDVAAGTDEVAKPVYDLQGRRVAADASELGSLRPGIYIVGGRKVLVR